MNPVIISIELNLHQALSIDEFRQESGRRAYGKLYYVLGSDNALVAEIVSDNTDVKQLQKQIENEQIYTPSYSKIQE